HVVYTVSSLYFFCVIFLFVFFFFFSSRRRHTRSKRDWSSDVCSSDLFTIVPVYAVAYSKCYSVVVFIKFKLYCTFVCILEIFIHCKYSFIEMSHHICIWSPLVKCPVKRTFKWSI